jgi:hypothetical protein
VEEGRAAEEKEVDSPDGHRCFTCKGRLVRIG